MKTDTLGEFELINRLTRNVEKVNKQVVVGIGDDCAVLPWKKDVYQLATCDVQVADVHFLPNIATPQHIGEKAIAVNVSDIAAMGGTPTSCLVSLLLPKNITTAYIDELYKGIVSSCKKYNIQIVGGNMSGGKQLAIDIFMLGEVNHEHVLLRSGAKAGDKVLVTGTLGDAAAGLTILQNQHIQLSEKQKTKLLMRQFSPRPRLAESAIIAQSKQATAMIDISDGLASDVQHVCDQSIVGIELWEEKIPIAAETIEVAKQLQRNPLSFALEGGEDYELLFTAPENAVDRIIATVQQKTNTQVTVIGEILPNKNDTYMRLKDGERKSLEIQGWDHLKRQS